ncbi:MAG: radical SAM protein, partial [Lacibacter sp.]
NDEPPVFKPAAKVIFLGKVLQSEVITKSKKGASWEVMQIVFATKKENISINTDPQKGAWLLTLLPKLGLQNQQMLTMQEIKDSYEQQGFEDFELFWDNKPISTLYKAGLLKL